MKFSLLLALLIPSAIFAQKIKVSEYDKFIRQTRIEAEPVTLLSTEKSNVAFTLSSTGNNLYVVLSGYGWGASAVDADQQAIFLFSNDSTVSLRSVGLQSYELGPVRNTYTHKYVLPMSAVEALGQYELVGIRKYNMNDFSDMKVAHETAARIRKSSALFMDELKKFKVIHTLKSIDLRDVGKYVGDSVMFTCKVYGTRYFDAMDDAPTLLDVNDSYAARPVNIVIWKRDLNHFNNDPALMYRNKEVCVRGVVQMINSIPQIVIHDRRQVSVKSPIALSEVPLYVGDTVTVQGLVMDGRYLTDTRSQPTLLNLGATYPDQLLTVVIGSEDRSVFRGQPEKDYVGKEIKVSGVISMYKDKPQILLRDPARLEVVRNARQGFYADSDKGVMNTALRTTTPLKKVEGTAVFPGGADALSTYFKTNLKCPQILNAGDLKLVKAAFSIAPDGTVTRIRILQSPGKTFNQEVIRVLKAMPRWQPAMRNGVAVASDITHDVVFRGVAESF